MTSLAKIVAITKPVVEGVNTPEEFVAYAARVSNPANQHNDKTAAKLVRYLIDNHHWSPLEMVQIVMEINTTRDIARQILRHRSFSFQEFSQRYADVSALGDMFEETEARLQDTKNRQNSIETDNKDLQIWWEESTQLITKEVEHVYKQALEKGIAKEVARKVLPEGLTKSRLYMAGSLRSWYHYCDLRCGNGTQKEHREVALACLEELKGEFPGIIVPEQDRQA